MRILLCLLIVACGGKPPPKAPNPDADLKPWGDVTAGYKRTAGLLATWSRRDGGVLIEVPASALDRDLGLAVTVARGTSVGGVLDGYYLDPGQLIRLRRIGRKIYVVQRTSVVAAPTKGAAGVGLGREVGESVLAALPVLSVSGDVAIVDATDWWTSDLSGLADSLKPTHSGNPEGPFALDKTRSFVERVRTFPRNVEADATLTFVPGKLPKVLLKSPANPYAVSVTVRYSIFELPEQRMAPREADDRIGYFLTPTYDVSKISAADRDRVHDVVHRWRLEKRDPGAAKSPPKTPITFYLDPSIPERYRPTVREGILAWNKAFEQLGFVGAIAVADAPADFDYLDLRYPSLHWSTTLDMGFTGYGPHHFDPRTGEILDADIIINAELLAEQATNAVFPARAGCLAQAAATQQIAMLHLLAGARGLDPDAYVPDVLRWTVMHEVGHTLGLRHNFRGSANTPFDKLHDKAWTGVHGVVSSVMDYPPLNVAPSGTAQGYFATPTIGDYDLLAIRYGYQDGDAAALRATAAQATTPGLAFATDDDNWLDDWATDPFTAGFDLGNDPIAFAGRQLGLYDEVLPTTATSVVREGEAWAKGRETALLLMAFRTVALLNTTKLIGGVDVRRVHRGDAGMPMVPIAPDLQRKALALVIERGLGDWASKLVTPDLLATMAPRRGRVFYEATLVPVDPPIHAVVLSSQARVIDALFHPARLHRIVDNSVRTTGKPFALSELFDGVTTALFSELAAGKPAISSYRRNAQRAYVARLLAIVREPDGAVPYGGPMVEGMPKPQPPPDARSLARAELKKLAKQAAAASPKAANAETSAHLSELADLINKTLDAPPLPPGPSSASEFILVP